MPFRQTEQLSLLYPTERFFLLSTVDLSIVGQFQSVYLEFGEFMEFSPDGNWLLLQDGSSYNQAYLWRVKDRILWASSPREVSPCPYPTPFHFSPDNSLIIGYTRKKIYSGLEANTIPTFFQTNTLAILGTLPTPLDINVYWFDCNLDISADSSLLAILAYETDKNPGRYVIQLWDIAKKKFLYSFPAFTNRQVRDIAFAPNSAFLAFIDENGFLHIWGIPEY